MKYLLLALQFLTVLPVKFHAPIKDEDYAKSLICFPVIGIVIGSILSVIALSCMFLPAAVMGIIVLIVSTLITGALHLDGFADTCDGFYGTRPKEEILKIMRDPKIGVMGAIGIALVLLLKFSLITGISKNALWRSLILMGCFSRWSQTLSCLLDYARNEGKARLFIKYARKRDIIIASLFTVFVCCVLFGLSGMAIFFSSLIPVVTFVLYAKAKIGGVTGDTIGAVNEIAEISALFFILIWDSIWT